MAYTVTKLITNAYYISGIVGREFQTVQGYQLNDGLDMLNDILSDKTVENDMIPYYSKYDFSLSPGVEEYFIPNLIEIETFVFFIDTVRYSTMNINRKRYFGASRADNIDSLPFTWHLERCFGGANLFLYFKPQTNYAAQLWGQFRLNEVTLNQDLSLTLDRFYINYLKYALSVRLCSEFDFMVPAGASKQLLQYEQMISKRSSPLDLTMTKVSTFTDNNSLNYAQINFGRGWTV